MKRTFYFTLLVSAIFGALPLRSEPDAPRRSEATPAQAEAQELDYMKKGEDHFFARRFGAALQWFRRALEINPDNALAHAYVGDILLSMGEPEQALKHFRVASELKADPATEYFRIGQIYFLQQNREQAENYFKRALQSDPNLAEAHFYLGLLSYRMGRNREETLSHLKTFRTARPAFADGEALNQAIALLEDPTTKLDQKKDLIEIDPLRLFYRKDNKAEGTNDEKKPNQVPDSGQKTQPNTEKNPQREVKSDEGKKPAITLQQPSDDTKPALQDGAVQDVAKSEQATPDQGFISVAPGPGPLFNQALVFREEDPARALKIVDQALQADGRDARLHSLRCEILFRKQADLGEALNACKQAAALSPDHRNYQNLGRVQEARKEMADAYASYVEALNLRMEPELALHAVHIGDTLPGKQMETRAILERMLARRPDHKEGLLTLMQRQQQDKNKVGLRTTMERLQSLYTDDADVLERMAVILLADPDTEAEAVMMLRRYYDQRPDDLRAGLSLAGLYLRRDNEKEALQILGALYETHPENYDVVRTILILFVRNNRNLDSAETIARQFLERNPPSEQRSAILEILPPDLRSRLAPPTDQKPVTQQPRDAAPPNTPVQP